MVGKYNVHRCASKGVASYFPLKGLALENLFLPEFHVTFRVGTGIMDILCNHTITSCLSVTGTLHHLMHFDHYQNPKNV